MIVLKSDWTMFEERDAVQPGVVTLELDKIAEKYRQSCGSAAAFGGNGAFPGTICTSSNEVIVHGSPGLKKLKIGDTVSIDVRTEINGCCEDTVTFFAVGEDTVESRHLLDVTETSLYEGIEQVMVSDRFGGASRVLHARSESHSYESVCEYVGHGIGRKMHEDPQIPNDGSAGRGPKRTPEMTSAIELEFNLGAHEVKTLDDEWTVITKDRKPSAYFGQAAARCGKAPEFLIKR